MANIHGPFKRIGVSTAAVCDLCGTNEHVWYIRDGRQRVHRLCEACLQETVRACGESKTERANKVTRPRVTNPCGKTVDRAHAYEVWQAGNWTWYVRKKYQASDDKPFARWYCDVVTPTVPEGETGDVYAADVMQYARRIK